MGRLTASGDPDRIGQFAVLGGFAFAGLGGLVQLASSNDALALACSAPGGLLLACRGVLQLNSPSYRERLLSRHRGSLIKQYPSPTVAGSVALVLVGVVWVSASAVKLLFG